LSAVAVARLASAFADLDLGAVTVADRGRRLEKLLLRVAGATAVTWGSRIIARPGTLNSDDAAGLELLAHELVHVRQYRALGRGTFLLRYFSEYLVGRWRGKSHARAYHDISFEVEARSVAAATVARTDPAQEC
jgi:hypothetical protein